ncbi:MAG: hypothetical protein KBT31_05730, partial [Firmicutes bacterium]|nr:hypothetical protein [Candidatus Colimorpha enterica]
MIFTDIHIHILPGVDDGADNVDVMKAMLDRIYDEGVRLVCATPHCSRELFGDNRKLILPAFEQLKEYAARYPDLKVCLGNELRYSQNCIEAVRDGNCLTLNGSRYVLIDFEEDESEKVIIDAMHRILSTGYTPVLAHAERYVKLSAKPEDLNRLRRDGVIIQVDSMSVFGGWGFSSKLRSRKILKNYCADVVGSDGHNLSSRPPILAKCYDYV